MPVKRKYKKRKTKVKFYSLKGLKCQGKKELRFIKECIRYKRTLPTKAARVLTPDGYYTPDFEYPDRYIEIKSLGTLKVCFGLESYKGLGPISDLQWRKIKWVAEHVKPIDIIVYLGRRDKIPTFNINEQGITISYKGGYRPKKSK